jgi:hypothetical protein
MKARPSTLDQLERWMQTVLMHPGGVAEGVASPQAREHVPIDPDQLGTVIARSRALSSAERLEIYVDAYHLRLMECLREEFPATRHSVGDELFDALAFGYLESFPSRSYTLARLGAQLPGYLRDTRLHAHQQPAGVGPTWTDFVIELARYERLLREVFDADGTERAAPFDVQALAAIPPQDWPGVWIRLSPDVRLAGFQHAVDDYWRQVQAGGGEPAVPSPATRCLAIHRRDYVIATHVVSAFELALLGALAEGLTVLKAISRAAETAGGSQAVTGEDVHASFSQWAELGFFAALWR